MKQSYDVVLTPLDAPRASWDEPADVWATILKLEENNTQNLLRIAQAADDCGQYGVKAFLDPFRKLHAVCVCVYMRAIDCSSLNSYRL